MDKKVYLKTPSICSCANMRRASRALTQFYDDLLQPSGLKVTQYSLLNHIKRLGPLTMNELSKAIRLERTTLIRNLKPLETEGLVVITTEGNSRVRLVNITDKGLKAIEAAFPYWEQAQQAFKELLSNEELQVLSTALQKVESIIP